MTKFSFSRFLLAGITIIFIGIIYFGCTQANDAEETTTSSLIASTTIITTTTDTDSTSTSTVEQATTTTNESIFTTTVVTDTTNEQQTTTTIESKPIIRIKRIDDIVLYDSTIDLGTITFGASIDVIFTIENIGTSNLTLINNLQKVDIVGDYFTLKSDVEYSVVQVDSSADFSINFKPLINLTNSYSCKISIPNDTDYQNPFVFNIVCNVLELNVFKVIPNPVICGSPSIIDINDIPRHLLIPVFTGLKVAVTGDLIGDVTPDTIVSPFVNTNF